MLLAASDRPSANERTSRTTVLIVPPLNVGVKIADQLFGRLKSVRLLVEDRVPVIALSALVVVAQDAMTAHDISQPILEPVCRPFEWTRKLPDDDLREGVCGDDDSALDDLSRWHALRLGRADGSVNSEMND
jgi:hypothetical protein